jgi:hypothetical protein
MVSSTGTRRGWGIVISLIVTALILTLGVAPLLTSGADHLDAPSLGHLSVNPDDTLNVGKVRGPDDINDLYVFPAATAGRTVLAVTVNPAVNLIGPATFDSGAEYTFNIDATCAIGACDATATTLYTVTFGQPGNGGVQHYVVKANGKAVASGFTNEAKGTTQSRDGVWSFAGLRSDPFFFDLLAFLGTVKGQGTSGLLDGSPSDFFVGLNTMAIVIEVPNAALGGNGANIGVWATTRSGGVQRDQMGRPAINTVFNGTAAQKEAFNTTAPSAQATAMGGVFHSNVASVLLAFSALDSELAYSSAQANGLADVLIPDALTYTVGTNVGLLDGRSLTRDVIDDELNIVTGGYPFPGRNAIGAIPGDAVGPHGDYLPSFPYLGQPHP